MRYIDPADAIKVLRAHGHETYAASFGTILAYSRDSAGERFPTYFHATPQGISVAALRDWLGY